MSGSGGIDVNMTTAGPVPTPPAVLRALLVALVARSNPGYTDNLPGSLIEDVASTDVGALSLIDQARVETINSLTPLGANPWLTIELGNIYGVPLGKETNTSVYVEFITDPPAPGQVIQRGFLVGDGTYQYRVLDGGILGSDGTSPLLFAVATVSGSWPVPAGTVNQLVTSPPPGITLSVINPDAGVPSQGAQSQASYRAQVLQAGLAASQGMARYLKTLLGNVDGVQQRLISVRQLAAGWEVICGGGDPYAVAGAIFNAVFDLPDLQSSTIGVTAITKAAAALITTDIAHGLTAGQANVHVAGVVGMTAINGGPYTVGTVPTPNSFTVNVDSSGFGDYVSGGVVTPNVRNISVSLNDYPDTYVVPFVNPLQQEVEITATWNTTSTNFVSAQAVAQLASQPLVDYVNSIPVGAPINVLSLDAVFRDAVASVLAPELVTRLVFAVSIDGTPVDPASGTVIIVGDPESYFFSQLSDVTVIQG